MATYNDSGWAFAPNAKEVAKQYHQHFRDTDYSTVKKLVKTVSYGKVEFKGELHKGSELTPFDILVYADAGSVCFGGSCTIDERTNTFYGRYHTD